METYNTFRASLIAKINIDAEAIGDNYAKAWYIFSWLEGAASSMVLPWITNYAIKDQVTNNTLEDLMKHLDLCFLDKNCFEKAQRGLNTLRQGNRPIADMLSDLNRLLMECGGHNWDDTIKKGYLDNALNHEMKAGMVAMDKKEHFEDYCRQVQQVGDRIEQIKRSSQAYRQN